MEAITGQSFADIWSSYLCSSKRYLMENWYKDIKKSPLSKHDFKFIRTIAVGGFGRVELAERKGTYYAIKAISKTVALNENNIKKIQNEKRTLQATKFPFIIHMEFYFVDNEYLYFVMPYMSGEDLWLLLRKAHKFNEDTARFYASQIVLALEYLHFMKIIHRDLKPENILINDDGYIKLADLGLCKRIEAMTYTLCGTTEYLAPEMLLNRGYGFAVDWWSFGVLLYEMTAGVSPFFCRDEWKICENILKCEYIMNSRFGKDLQDLIGNLLQIDPTKRYGNLSKGVRDVRDHRWFLGVNWMDVFNRAVPPPFFPELSGSADQSNLSCPIFDNH